MIRSAASALGAATRNAGRQSLTKCYFLFRQAPADLSNLFSGKSLLVEVESPVAKMFIGHFAVGFAAKRFAPRASLGWLLAAPMFLDLIWPLFLLAGLEAVRIDPGNTAFTPLDFVSYPWSHSLLMALIWAALFAGLYHWRTRYLPGSIAIGLGVASHWLLDFVSHGRDMPLAPGVATKVGLGLWNHVAATVTVELAMLTIGVALYVSATRAAIRAGSLGFWAFLALLGLLYAGAARGAPPPNVTVLVVTALSAWLAVWWAAWFDRNRVPRSEQSR